MEKFIEIFNALVIETLQKTYQSSITVLPNIAFAVAILLIGWICALLLRKVVAKLLKAVGVDVLAEKVGIKSFLEKGGVSRSLSSMIGLILYWIIIFSTLVMLFNTLELDAATQLLDQSMAYVPRILIGLVLLTLGIFLSKFICNFVRTSARLAHITFYILLGEVARYGIIALTLMIVLESLGISSILSSQFFLIIFGIIPLICVLLLVVGGRDMLSDVIAGRILIREYKKGDTIGFDSVSGDIKSINITTTKLTAGAQELVIPNSELTRKTVKKVIK